MTIKNRKERGKYWTKDQRPKTVQVTVPVLLESHSVSPPDNQWTAGDEAKHLHVQEDSWVELGVLPVTMFII